VPRTIPIQTSFAGGEISPKLHGRVDTELWRKGLDYCENFEPLAHGPLLSRGGTRWVSSFATLTRNCRLMEFPRQGDVGFLLLFGGGALRVLDGLSGAAVQAGAIDWIVNPRFTYGWESWTTLYAEVVNGRYLLRPSRGGAVGTAYQTTVSLDAGTYTVSIQGATASGNWLDVFVGTTVGGTDLLDEDFSTDSLSSKGAATYTITLGAPATVTLYVQTGSSSAEYVGDREAGAELLELAIREAGTGAAVWDSTTTPAFPWTDTQLGAIQVVSEPARDRMMFFHPEVAPYELSFDRTSGAWTFQAITFTFTDMGNPDWESPNFPGVAELYQGRLVVAGIPGKLNKLLGSKSGEPYDFTLGTNANDAFSLDVSTKGAIRWLAGHRTLLMGTDRGEYIVTAQGGILTPSDFEIRPQSGNGCASVQAVQVMDQAMYVSRDRRRLRMLSFNLQENGWQTRDLTFTSEHLTGGKIREIDWLSTGNDQVYAVMASGEVVAWSFNRAEQVIAPWRATFGGEVYSLCVLEAGDQDRVWMLVQRVGTVCLEEWLVSDDDTERCLLDSYAVSNPGAGTAGGYTWLAGETVVAICDGVAGDPQVVSPTGVITVPVSATTCVAGIFSPRTVTTLPKEGGMPGGTAQGSKQRMVKATLRLNDSALPLIDGVRCAPDRSPLTPMGVVSTRLTEDVTARVLGWEAKGAITITQDVPLRTEILAIFGVVSTNEV
jgi:hypothetical protein